MNIAIIGYGKMGHEIEKAARARGINVVSIIDTEESNATHKNIDENSLKNADVCIDFTNPNAIVGNIKKISKLKKNIVVGTTGWNNQISEVRKIVKQSNIGLIYASNFSIGVNVFFRMIENAARIMNNVEAYDVFGYDRAFIVDGVLLPSAGD